MSQADGKRVFLPKGLKRAAVIGKEKRDHLMEFEYDKALHQDFEENRAEYTEIIMHGVPVKVKVEKDERPEFKLRDPKLK